MSGLLGITSSLKNNCIESYDQAVFRFIGRFPGINHEMPEILWIRPSRLCNSCSLNSSPSNYLNAAYDRFEKLKIWSTVIKLYEMFIISIRNSHLHYERPRNLRFPSPRGAKLSRPRVTSWTRDVTKRTWKSDRQPENTFSVKTRPS